MTEKKKVSSPIPDKTQHAIINAFKSGMSLTKTAARFGVSRHAVTRIVRAKNVLPPPTPKAKAMKKMSEEGRLQLLRERVDRVFGRTTPPVEKLPTPTHEQPRPNIPPGMRVVDYNRLREAHVFEEAYEHIRRTTAAKPVDHALLPGLPGAPPPVFADAETLKVFQSSLRTINDMVADVITALGALVANLEKPR